jgi:outer membrane receptor protein involved in Fe transport
MKPLDRKKMRNRGVEKIKLRNQGVYWTVISLAAWSGGRTALAQTNAVAGSENSTNVTVLGNVTVIGKLNQAREQIVTDLGATSYAISKDQIASQSQGDNAPFNEIILRAPGVAQDSAANGDLHVRGEHANLQYRIDDVLLPEGISGFGLELDPRFVQSLQFITGSLPAEYGFRTAAVVDIQTKSGAFENGGEAGLYGGSFGTIRPSFEYGGTQGKWDYFLDGSYDHNDLGIENTTGSSSAIHDTTDQYKSFVYASRILSDTSRISLIGSVSYATFQIPIDPNQQPTSTQGNGNPWYYPSAPPQNFSPTDLNDNQTEQNYYGVAAFQKSAGDFNLQVAAFGRESSAHYVPDNIPATLYYNGGIATDEDRILTSGGLQADASYDLGEHHTIRGGVMGWEEAVTANTTTTVFPVDGSGNISGPAEAITQNNSPEAFFYGMYLQDEWKLVPKILTLNYGARWDYYSSSVDTENQVSPRVNLVYQPFDSTTMHIGYSRYFTPPPLETVPASDLAVFNDYNGSATSAQQALTTDTVVKAERANYYDAGISQKLAPGLTVGVDGYYKTAQQQLDDGLFGQSLILSSFNYAQGRVRGVEFTANYTTGGWSTYANLAYSVAQGKGASSAQFLWGNQNVVNYVNNNWIYLDHDQRVTGSFGTAYTWKESARQSTRVYADALYGTGLRQNGPGLIPNDPDGDGIPNGSEVPTYYTVNLGVEQSLKIGVKDVLKARLDVVNVTDNSYELRSGTGVGVNAAQYGMRRGLFGSVSFVF